MVQLRRLFRVVNGGTPTADPVNWDGPVPWATPADLAPVNGGHIGSTARSLTDVGVATGSATVPAGSLIVSTRAPIGYVAQNNVPMAFNQGCRALVPISELDVRFFRYVLAAFGQEMQSRGQGSTFSELSSSALASIELPAPDHSDQQRIADFLDAETTRTGAVVERRQRLVGLAEERFRNLRERRLFGGSIDRWISIGRLIDVLPGFAFSSDDFVPPNGADAVRLLRGANVTPGSVRWNDTVALPAERAASFTAWHLEVGDLVLGMDRPLISSGMRVAVVTPDDVPSLLVQRVARIRAKAGANQAYVRHLLTSDAFVGYFEPIVTGVSVPHISESQIRAFRVPLRPFAEQCAIANELAKARHSLDALRSSAARQIGLLGEHREALIIAAVTGQLEEAKGAA